MVCKNLSDASSVGAGTHIKLPCFGQEEVLASVVQCFPPKPSAV